MMSTGNTPALRKEDSMSYWLRQAAWFALLALIAIAVELGIIASELH